MIARGQGTYKVIKVCVFGCTALSMNRLMVSLVD